jgi:selenophosphate synthetase-related protein
LAITSRSLTVEAQSELSRQRHKFALPMVGHGGPKFHPKLPTNVIFIKMIHAVA